MNSEVRNIDDLVVILGGCGLFQVTLSSLVFLVKIVGSMSMIMMVFGNYNPGWHCLDNATSTATITSTAGAAATARTPEISVEDESNFSSSDYNDKCRDFESCTQIQFQPGIVSVVTEWSLVCSRAWISSLIISLQMVGVLVGAFLSGYLGDKIGRKRIMYIATFHHMVMNVAIIFSNSWQMFAVLRFFIGIAIPVMMYLPVLFVLEFVEHKWRNPVMCMPLWTVGCIIFAATTSATRDWKYVHGINAIASFIALLPCLWVNESLRWLVVKNRTKESRAVVKRMANLNHFKATDIEMLQPTEIPSTAEAGALDFSCFLLLRPGFRYATVVIGFSCVIMSVVYYAISFSIKSLPGSFFVNLYILFASELPVIPISSILPNYIGRKPAIIIFLLITTASLVSIVALDLRAEGSLRNTGILISALFARTFAEPAWDIMITLMSELFPTVIRSTSIAYCNWISRIGGILAPYLIPNDPRSYFINYLLMASLVLFCCGFVFFLPETKGKPLQETWDQILPAPKRNFQTESQG